MSRPKRKLKHENSLLYTSHENKGFLVIAIFTQCRNPRLRLNFPPMDARHAAKLRLHSRALPALPTHEQANLNTPEDWAEFRRALAAP